MKALLYFYSQKSLITWSYLSGEGNPFFYNTKVIGIEQTFVEENLYLK